MSGPNITTSLYSYSEDPGRPPVASAGPAQVQTSENSSFSEEPVKLRQTGRQSGRFRKSSTMSSLSDKQRPTSQRPNSSFSQQTNVAQTAFMDSLIVESISRPTTPGVTPTTTEPRKKVSSISRTESYRRARGTEEERPRVKRNETFNSLPRSQARGMRRGNSEESLRNAMDSEQRTLPRSKSRQEKKGECSVM